MFSRFASAAGFAIAAAAFAPSLAAAADIQIGQLTCHQTDRTNLVIFSKASFDCAFERSGAAAEHYAGKTSKIGIDLTAMKVETMVWYVFAPSAGEGAGELQGAYIGASADAAIGAGAGVRVLVGGFENSFTLQPASFSGQQGVGIAAGIEEFELTYLP